jgi:hypothetical protein
MPISTEFVGTKVIPDHWEMFELMSMSDDEQSNQDDAISDSSSEESILVEDISLSTSVCSSQGCESSYSSSVSSVSPECIVIDESGFSSAEDYEYDFSFSFEDSLSGCSDCKLEYGDDVTCFHVGKYFCAQTARDKEYSTYILGLGSSSDSVGTSFLPREFRKSSPIGDCIVLSSIGDDCGLPALESVSSSFSEVHSPYIESSKTILRKNSAVVLCSSSFDVSLSSSSCEDQFCFEPDDDLSSSSSFSADHVFVRKRRCKMENACSSVQSVGEFSDFSCERRHSSMSENDLVRSFRTLMREISSRACDCFADDSVQCSSENCSFSNIAINLQSYVKSVGFPLLLVGYNSVYVYDPRIRVLENIDSYDVFLYEVEKFSGEVGRFSVFVNPFMEHFSSSNELWLTKLLEAFSLRFSSFIEEVLFVSLKRLREFFTSFNALHFGDPDLLIDYPRKFYGKEISAQFDIVNAWLIFSKPDFSPVQLSQAFSGDSRTLFLIQSRIQKEDSIFLITRKGG